MSLQKKTILVSGSLTYDLFLKPCRETIWEKEGQEFLSFPLGDKIRINDRYETFGGGGANVALGLQRFGNFSPLLLGAVGADESGEKIIHHLQAEGVQTSEISRISLEGSGFSLILSAKTGERTVFFCPGANRHLVDMRQELLHSVNVVAIQHLSGDAEQILEKITQHFQQFPEKFLSWNPGRESLEKGVSVFQRFFPLLDFLLLNADEAELFTGEHDLQKIWNRLFSSGLRGVSVITDGQKGAWGSDGTSAFFCPTFQGFSRVDTLGAGDAFLTGMLGAFCIGKDLPTAMKYATINAASVVSCFGAQKGLLSAKNIEEKIAQLIVSPL